MRHPQASDSPADSPRRRAASSFPRSQYMFSPPLTSRPSPLQTTRSSACHLFLFFFHSEENFKVDVKNSQCLCLRRFTLSLFLPKLLSQPLANVCVLSSLPRTHPPASRHTHAYTSPHLALSPASTLCPPPPPVAQGWVRGGRRVAAAAAEAAVWAWSAGGRGRLSASEPLTRV